MQVSKVRIFILLSIFFICSGFLGGEIHHYYRFKQINVTNKISKNVNILVYITFPPDSEKQIDKYNYLHKNNYTWNFYIIANKKEKRKIKEIKNFKSTMKVDDLIVPFNYTDISKYWSPISDVNGYASRSQFIDLDWDNVREIIISTSCVVVFEKNGIISEEEYLQSIVFKPKYDKEHYNFFTNIMWL